MHQNKTDLFKVFYDGDLAAFYSSLQHHSSNGTHKKRRRMESMETTADE
jgi:hypothetical protein